MSESAYLPGLAIQNSEVLDSPRYSAVVRVTHWIHALSFLALVVSGIAILLAHTRFYWGETGGEGAPSLFDLPLRLHRADVSGWGRSLHFLSAWICVPNGLFYAVSGLVSQHFRKDLLPDKAALAWTSIARTVSNHLHFRRPSEEESLTYNVIQRLVNICRCGTYWRIRRAVHRAAELARGSK
jgi:thiosulfate reductase cytochrome b subunit